MKQTESQAIGRKGERWFQNILPKEWIFQRPSEDIGIDGAVIIGATNRISNLEFGVQIKASRRWTSKHNRILLPNVGREKVVYWASRLIPTMLALYDEDKDRGYYAWVIDLIPDLRGFLSSKTATVTLKVPKESRLDEKAWGDIHERVRAYYTELADSLSKINPTRAILPTLSSLATSLQLLHFSEFKELPQTQNEEMLLQLGNVTAHKEVINSLRAFVAQIRADSELARRLRTVIAAYRNEVDTFVDGFDTVLNQKDEHIAVWTNAERMEQSRPKLIILITELIMTLSRVSSARDVAQGDGA